MSYHVLIIRDTFTETTTTGKLYINGNYFCETLEDASRGLNVKVDAKTCIPEGTYFMNVTHSPRFEKELPIIFNQPNGFELINGGISFKGIRTHGGNTHANSEGCILVAKQRVNAELIKDSMSDKLTIELISLGKAGYITVINKPK
jgi:hypothetical protein